MFFDNKIFAVLFILLFCKICANDLFAQESGHLAFEEAMNLTQMEAEVYLLRNSNQRIPIKRLDTLTFVSYTVGLSPNNTFQQILKHYAPDSSVVVTNAQQLSFISDQTPKGTPLSYQNIIGLDLNHRATWEQDPLLKKWLEKISESTQNIIVVFGNADHSLLLPPYLQNCQHLIYIPSNSDWAQSFATQLIFGGLGATTKLRQDWGSFKTGSGISSEGHLRLRYSLPQWLGMSAQILKDSIDAIVSEAIRAGAFPGAQILVAKDGHIVFHEAYGQSSFQGYHTVSTTDLYDFASVSKITTALPALMKLHGEGRFDLDAPLKKYFPKAKKSNKAELNFRAILSHQARLKPWIPYWKNTVKKNGKFKWKTFKTKTCRRYPTPISSQLYIHKKYRKKIYKAIFKSPLNEKTAYQYSGLAFYLFPEMISELTQQPFEQYLQNTFYRRLGASSLGFNPLQRFPKERIIPTERDTFFRKEMLHGYVHDEGAAMMGGISANAGLFGNANDLAKLMQMYLNKGTYGGERYIAAATIEEFTRCQFCESGNRRGLGFDKPLIEYHPQNSSTAKSASPESYGHSGYTGTFTWVDPAKNLIYIFLSNRVHPSRENRKIYELNIRPRIHQVIYDAVNGKR